MSGLRLSVGKISSAEKTMVLQKAAYLRVFSPKEFTERINATSETAKDNNSGTTVKRKPEPAKYSGRRHPFSICPVLSGLLKEHTEKSPPTQAT